MACIGIPDAEMAQIRADVAAIVGNLDCVVQRRARTSDGMGQDTEVWTTIATVKVSMAQPSVAQLQIYDFQIGSQVAWIVRFPYGTDVQVQDKLLINNKTLVVQGTFEPRSYAALLSVLASEVNNG